jgi:hypothetical protein
VQEYLLLFDKLIGEIMAVMTEEEADALDEKVTKYPPKVDPAKARFPVRMIAVDDMTAEYLTIKAAATHQTPEEVLSGLVRKELALTAG